MYTKSGHILVLDVFALVKNACNDVSLFKASDRKKTRKVLEKKTLIVFYTSNAKKPK